MTLKQKDDFKESLDGLNSWAIWEIVEDLLKQERDKVIVALKETQTKTFPVGERPWCKVCAKRIYKFIKNKEAK